MEQKINIAELLYGMLRGLELYSPILGECRLEDINPKYGVIDVMPKDCNIDMFFDKYGVLCYNYGVSYEQGKCLLFPSKDYQSWEGVQVVNGELVIPEVKTQTYGKFYSYGNPKRFEDIKAAFKKYGAKNVDDYNDCDYCKVGWMFYLDNLGYIHNHYDSIKNEQELIAQGYKELDLSYKPKDKDLVWCYDKDDVATRLLGFYDEKNHRGFTYDGKRDGYEFSKYEPYEGEYPDWAKEALKHLED